MITERLDSQAREIIATKDGLGDISQQQQARGELLSRIRQFEQSIDSQLATVAARLDQQADRQGRQDAAAAAAAATASKQQQEELPPSAEVAARIQGVEQAANARIVTLADRLDRQERAVRQLATKDSEREHPAAAAAAEVAARVTH